MTEKEMITLLEKLLSSLHRAGVDVSGDQIFFDVGEWLLAFEGVYVASRRLHGGRNTSEVEKLVSYFGVDMSELDE